MNRAVSPEWVSLQMSPVTRLGESFLMFVGDSEFINQYNL